MKIIEQYFGTSTPMDDVSVEAAEDFKLWLSSHGKEDGTGLATRSVNNVIDFARSIFRYAQRMGWLSGNVFEFVKPRRAMPVYAPDPFTPEEVEAILSTARSESDLSWFYPVVLCAALTGCRRGALPQMLVSDYDPERKQLALRGEIAKQGRPFCYAVPDVLANELSVLVKGREPDDSLFIDRQGKPLNIKAFDTPDRNAKKIPPCRTWYRLLQRASLRPRGIHNLRRAAVSNLAEADVTMDKIVAVTGQSVDVARNLYLRIDRETQRNTMEKLAALYRQQVESPTEEPNCQPVDNAEAKTFVLRISQDELDVLRALLHRKV
jgi:integrase